MRKKVQKSFILQRVLCISQLRLKDASQLLQKSFIFLQKPVFRGIFG